MEKDSWQYSMYFMISSPNLIFSAVSKCEYQLPELIPHSIRSGIMIWFSNRLRNNATVCCHYYRINSKPKPRIQRSSHDIKNGMSTRSWGRYKTWKGGVYLPVITVVRFTGISSDFIRECRKKSKNSDFGNFAFNEISSSQALNLQIWSFSTVSSTMFEISSLGIL